MVTLLLTSVFIIGILAVALYLWQKPSTNNDHAPLPPLPPPRGFFNEFDTAETASANTGADETEQQRSLFIERAQDGDKSVLQEAYALADKEFYDEVLDLLVTNADSDAGLLSLTSYIARHELPVNNNLALAVLASWKTSPNRNSTAKALHVAALADDAELYRSAVEAALEYWRVGTLADVSPVELQALFDGEFWVLSSRTRSSGAGFVLKRILANARRELGNTTSVNQ